MRNVKVAVTQMSISWDREEVMAKAEKMVRNAATDGANIILLQELFETPYFCQTVNDEYFNLARPAVGNPMIEKMQNLAKELNVVLPVSFYEKDGGVLFNTIAVIDADGVVLGYYRKMHIPDDPGYYEKFYFTPGDTGFRVWNTKFGKIGVGVCYDQWFCESARVMAINGAELIFYPTAVGSFSGPVEEVIGQEPTHEHWENVMRGHSSANMVPIIASNRIGLEVVPNEDLAMVFFGGSFMTDNIGNLAAKMGSDEGYLIHEYDLDALAEYRQWFHMGRDRRLDAYGDILTYNGTGNGTGK